MFMTHFKRIIRSGYRSFVRSGFTSFASVLIMIVTLFVITSLIFVQATLHSALSEVKDKVDITVYFVPGAGDSDIESITAAVKKIPEVKEVTYTTQDQALKDFKEKHANDYSLLQVFDILDDNPLGGSLNIRARDPSQYESIARFFDSEGISGKGMQNVIDKVDYHQNKVVIDRLSSIITGAERLGFAVSLVFIIISLIITFNTIRLIIYMSRDEISVMKLVGAGPQYIRGPFIVSGMLVGVCAAVITFLLFIPISIWLGNQMTDFIGLNLFTYFKANGFQLFIIMLGSGIFLGGVSSVFAVHRYLRK